MLEIYIGWGLFIPLVLYILRGYVSLRAMKALDYSRTCTFLRGFVYILPEMSLFCLWCILEIHLTVVYVLVFVCYAFRWCLKSGERSRGFFMVSLAQPLFMAFHMIVISLVSLIERIPMGLILHKPFWRIATISVAVTVSILADLVILNWPRLQETLCIQAASDEKRPFMAFLWFCNIFLLLDSLLCMAQIRWKLLPLLLIGAAVLKEFFIVHSLFHLRSIILERHMEEEHRILAQKLEQQERRTKELKDRSERDVLTGLFSRQYLMEQMERLLEEKRRFSLVFLDLDSLKQINDSQGHAAGDVYLIQFSQYVSRQLREEDVFARIGGDEFVILLLDCGKEDAGIKLEKMRAEITDGQFEYVPSFGYGIAEADTNTEKSALQLLENADKFMYQDKERRRH